MQQVEPRFDWPEVRKAVILIIAGSATFAIVIPFVGALLGSGETGPTAGNDIFLWALRAVLWGLIIWRGSKMGQAVGDRIVDDMLVTSAIAAGIWLFVKIIIVVAIYQASSGGERNGIIEINDLLAMAAAVLISWVAAKANRF